MINALTAAGPDDQPAAGNGGRLTNAPLQSRVTVDLEQQAVEALQRSLPEYAGISSVLVMDELPRTPDGRVDEGALPAVAGPEDTGKAAAGGRVPPRTADELRLARIWERALGVRSVDVRTSFFDLGGDSLLAIRVIDEAARALGRDVPLAVLLQDPTIEGMAAALRSERDAWSPLVEITPGDGTPFFCVHPAGGTVLCYAELGRLLGSLPFYALSARGVEGDDAPYRDLPAMAARYLRDVRVRQPSGPYLLGGWSMGGLVAYEMAQQLVAEGAEVDELVLIETPTPDLIDDLPDESAVLAQLLQGVIHLDLDELRSMPPADRLRRVQAEAERAQVLPPGLDPDRVQRLFDVYSAHLDAARHYRPGEYGGRACLVRAAHSRVATGADGWGGLLTGPWELVEVPGSHETVLWPPNVQAVAEALRARLAAVRVPA